MEKGDLIHEYWKKLLEDVRTSNETEVKTDMEKEKTLTEATTSVKLPVGVSEGRIAGIMTPYEVQTKLRDLLGYAGWYHFEINFYSWEEETES